MPKKETKVLIETYKGVDIFYDKNDHSLCVDYPKMDIHLKEESMWRIKGEIDSLNWVDCDIDGYVKSFGLYKVKAFRKNTSTKRTDYKVIDDAKQYGSDKGKVYSDSEEKIYPPTPDNDKIWKEVKAIYDEVKKLDRKADSLINSLSVGKKII
jgi:hypothetical protein